MLSGLPITENSQAGEEGRIVGSKHSTDRIEKDESADLVHERSHLGSADPNSLVDEGEDGGQLDDELLASVSIADSRFDHLDGRVQALLITRQTQRRPIQNGEGLTSGRPRACHP